MKVLISKKTGNYYYYKTEGDYHCKEGVIKEEDINGGDKIVKSNMNREFLVLEGNNYDLMQKMKRGPQILLPKDLGYILSRTGIDKNSFVVEAGSGSGAATCFFARFVSKVFSCEVVEDHYKLSVKNATYFGVGNVDFVHGDLKDHIDSKSDIDLLFLDMPDPAPILNSTLNGVKSGKYIVCYLPSISQIQEATRVISTREDLYLEEITEVSLRHWKVWDRISRPEHKKEIDHTAFLVFIRKV